MIVVVLGTGGVGANGGHAHVAFSCMPSLLQLPAQQMPSPVLGWKLK